MKITSYLSLFFLVANFSKAQEFDFNKVNISQPSISMSHVVLESGSVVRSYKVIPRDIDSYAEQKITGIIITTDSKGEFLRLDPIMHKVDLMSISDVIKAIEADFALNKIFEDAHFNELSEIQKLAFFRKLATAMLVCDDLSKLKFKDQEKQIFEQNLKAFKIEINTEPSVDELRSLAKLILREVSLK
jgi:hypothetical protein